MLWMKVASALEGFYENSNGNTPVTGAMPGVVAVTDGLSLSNCSKLQAGGRLTILEIYRKYRQYCKWF